MYFATGYHCGLDLVLLPIIFLDLEPNYLACTFYTYLVVFESSSIIPFLVVDIVGSELFADVHKVYYADCFLLGSLTVHIYFFLCNLFLVTNYNLMAVFQINSVHCTSLNFLTSLC